MEFQEIEHKFVVDESFDVGAFTQRVSQLSPITQTRAKVSDTYYRVENYPDLIFRHRVDHELQQFSLKSFHKGANESRTEINLDLDLELGNQERAVYKFLLQLGPVWKGAIQKNVQVFYFADCEIVFYTAQTPEKKISCIEFEAVNPRDLAAGLGILESYESKLGFAASERCEASLFELMFTE